MKPLDFPLLLDENVAPDVVEGLRERSFNLRTLSDEHLIGRPDVEVLGRATELARVVVTHDLGFGRAAVADNSPFLGIIYLRPGHISAAFVLAVVDALHASALDVEPPFVVVAERQQTTVRVRTRTAPPW